MKELECLKSERRIFITEEDKFPWRGPPEDYEPGLRCRGSFSFVSLGKPRTRTA